MKFIQNTPRETEKVVKRGSLTHSTLVQLKPLIALNEKKNNADIDENVATAHSLISGCAGSKSSWCIFLLM